MAVVINTKSRAELKAFFTTGSRPSAAQFGLLIDAMVNAKDDSLAKSNASPLRLQAEQTGQPNAIQKVAEFYNNFSEANPVADLSLKSPQALTASGLSVNVNNTSLMFFNAGSGNVGVKTSTPEFGLDINTSVRLGGFQANENEGWPNVVWLRTVQNAGGDWDEGLIKIPSNLTMNGKSAFGIHFEQSRSFNFYTTGWSRVMGISKNRIAINAPIHFENQPFPWNPGFYNFSEVVGNAAIYNDNATYNTLMILGRKRTDGLRWVNVWDNLGVAGSFTPSAGIGNRGIVFPRDPGGGSGDVAYIQYYVKAGESTRLDIANMNDVDDDIWIHAGGNVIINNAVTPSDKRLKENITPLAYGLEQIKKLLPVSYDWKNAINRKKSIGLLAQDVETVINEAVFENKKDKDSTEFSLSYNSLIPVLINAIKELDQKLEDAQLKLAQLQS